jgi:membrane fusion protein (multidrug efflux system)
MKPDRGSKSWRDLSPASIALWTLLALVVVVTIVMAKLKPSGEEVDAVPEKAMLVRTTKVQPDSISDVITLPGRVAADVVVSLSAEKNGRVIELNADRGDAVKKGQVLLRVDGRHWEVLRDRAAIELADAERDLGRWTKLKGEGAVSSSEFDSMKRRRDLAKAADSEAAVHLSQCRVVSPVDGVVDGRFVESGEYVVEGQPVFKVVSTNRLKVVVNVPEQDVSALKVGMPIRMSCSALPGEAIAGQVAFVARDGDPNLNTFAVEVDVLGPPARLKPGMIADVALERGIRENAIVVPFAVVMPKRGEHVVFVVEDDRAVLRVVQIDSIIGQNVVLSGGLAPGDHLVVEGHRTLQDGVSVSLASDNDGEQE